MNWYIDVLKKYAVFDGRASRQEFWMFVLINFIVTIVVNVIGSFISPIIGAVYGLAVLLPGIGVGVRRLHDTNRSGWFLLLSFIPIVGAIVLIVFWAQDSQPGDNRFGPSPKAAIPIPAV